MHRSTIPRMHIPTGFEIRYERSFLLDLKRLEPTIYRQVCEFVFESFPNIHQLQDLPEFRRIGSSQIFYRFDLQEYLVGLEITGQIVKFLRILPKPKV